ncbi:uncharacterized protein LOC144923025 isoform X4 [Branchiostoma floridae x Branchiostoma belcheri]
MQTTLILGTAKCFGRGSSSYMVGRSCTEHTADGTSPREGSRTWSRRNRPGRNQPSAEGYST